MAAHNDTGKKGEDLALAFLELKNFKILERNWRHRRSEVDIIAMHDKILVFVEVKTRSSDAFGRPEEFVSLKKQDLLTRAAPIYMEKIGHDWEIRFDVVSILLFKNGTYEIQHFEDAFF